MTTEINVQQTMIAVEGKMLNSSNDSVIPSIRESMLVASERVNMVLKLRSAVGLFFEKLSLIIFMPKIKNSPKAIQWSKLSMYVFIFLKAKYPARGIISWKAQNQIEQTIIVFDRFFASIPLQRLTAKVSSETLIERSKI